MSPGKASGAGSLNRKNIMQTRGADTQTLLEGQDIHLTANFRGLITAIMRRDTGRRPRPAPHDFLLLCPLPDFVPEALPEKAANPAVQSCERNMPQK